ncbi:MAG: AAA family ATPase [Anaerolineae bacterium]|nr:AAA family ATPase [Anaerolineae bacterium]
MDAPVLTTKLYIPPPRPNLVSRPRLIERLNAGLLGQSGSFTRKLTLISAPAGFGKTTLLSEWVASLERPVAWLSLDERDDDPARFWSYVIAALRTVPAFGEDSFAETLLAALQSPQPPGNSPSSLEPTLTALINEIAAVPVPFLLVLDDYHLIKAPPVHQAVSFLLDHLPPHLHLTIASRSAPPPAPGPAAGPGGTGRTARRRPALHPC